MSLTEASAGALWPESADVASRDAATHTSRALIAALILLYLVALAGAGLVTIKLQASQPRAVWLLPLIIGLLVSFILSIIPVFMCLVHAQARRRQRDKLMSIWLTPVRNTTYYRIAYVALKQLNPVRLSREYSWPMITFTAVTLFSCFGVVLSSFFLESFSHPSFILAGMRLTNAIADGQIKVRADVEAYQRGTFVILTIAFLGAYVYTLGRLLDRLNNNDLYPISFYYYAARMVIACIVALVIRHSAATVPKLENTDFLVLLAFVIGIAPDLFILSMARRAFQYVKVFGQKDDPMKVARPTALPLLMIDDLTRDKVDRLNELGIDSAQILACQNPFMIWPRLPYDLGLVVDWIAAAQLYQLVKEMSLKTLRMKCVRDIFDLHVRLSDNGAREEICVALGIKTESADAVIKQLEQNQSFCRLKEVRDAMMLPWTDAPMKHDRWTISDVT
jgi:uncharacterized integral membrane protein